MKKLSAAVLVFLVAAAPATAQTSAKIALSASPDNIDCNLQDVAGIYEIQVIVTDVTGLSAIQFAAPRPTCWLNSTFLSEEYLSELVIGESQDPVGGVSVAFGDCLDGPVHVGTLVFMSSGQSQPCCEYPIVKATGDLYPEIDGPIVVLCSDPTHVAGISVDAVINPEPGCPCLGPVGAEESTWGTIKALYR